MTIKFVPIHNITLAAGFLCVSSSTEAATWYVNNANVNCATADGSTAKPFCTIQEAVDTAVSGDTVQVAAGTYDAVHIQNKSLKLFGVDPQPLGTNIGGIEYGIKLSGFTTAGQVEIAYFFISPFASANHIGVWIEGPNAFGNVHNCILSQNYTGVYVKNAGLAKVSNNVITDSTSFGVQAYSGYNDITLVNNIIQNNKYGANVSGGAINSSYNIYFQNSYNRYIFSGSINILNDKDNIDPKFVDAINMDYQLQAGSPAINAGSPLIGDLDPDGSRNDIGVYGGPGLAFIQSYSSGRPVVTNLTITPSNVNQNGTFTLQATGQAQPQ